MKKLTTLLTLLASFTFFSSSALAVEAEGTIDEVRVCGASSQGNWINLTYFKLSTGQWFFILTNYLLDDQDDNTTYSLVMTAYTSRYNVKVNANYKAGDTAYNRCGVTPAAGLWSTEGDYIALKEYSE